MLKMSLNNNNNIIAKTIDHILPNNIWQSNTQLILGQFDCNLQWPYTPTDIVTSILLFGSLLTSHQKL